MTSTLNKMNYCRLGGSGLKVSKIILGCMSYGSPEWTMMGSEKWVLDEPTSIAHIKRAYDLGIQTFDTADVYSNGEGERVLGRAIKQHNLPRDNLVIMTKLGLRVSSTVQNDGMGRVEAERNGFVNQQGLSRKYIFSAVNNSLERLGIDYIDVLQAHRFDPDTPIEETMQAFHDIVKSGKVRYIGMSSCYAYQFHTMQNYAIANHLTPFISFQPFYNALYREEERESIPLCRQLNVGVIPWSPLCQGTLARPLELTGHSARSQKKSMPESFFTESTKEIISVVGSIAQSRDVPLSVVALAWVLQQPGISAPIVGSTSIKHLEEVVQVVTEGFKLTNEEIERISKPYTPKPIVSVENEKLSKKGEDVLADGVMTRRGVMGRSGIRCMAKDLRMDLGAG